MFGWMMDGDEGILILSLINFTKRPIFTVLYTEPVVDGSFLIIISELTDHNGHNTVFSAQ